MISLDIDPQALKAAKVAFRLPKTRSELIQASITNLPFRDRAIGSVIASEVLEHIPNVKECLSEIARVLREAHWR